MIFLLKCLSGKYQCQHDVMMFLVHSSARFTVWQSTPLTRPGRGVEAAGTVSVLADWPPCLALQLVFKLNSNQKPILSAARCFAALCKRRFSSICFQVLSALWENHNVKPVRSSPDSKGRPADLLLGNMYEITR